VAHALAESGKVTLSGFLRSRCSSSAGATIRPEAAAKVQIRAVMLRNRTLSRAIEESSATVINVWEI
jgi:hypothetical protein